jgi:hypothetical protein
MISTTARIHKKKFKYIFFSSVHYAMGGERLSSSGLSLSSSQSSSKSSRSLPEQYIVEFNTVMIITPKNIRINVLIDPNIWENIDFRT